VRRLRQREDLEDASVKRDKVLFDEAVSGGDVVIEGDLERAADAVVAVVADAVSVTGKDEKKIESALEMAESRKESVV